LKCGVEVKKDVGVKEMWWWSHFKIWQSQKCCGGSEKVAVVDENLPQLSPVTTTLT
jgi:hypothetical protein